MTLISRCACVDGCGFPILPRGMSLGSFLLLLFLVLILAYLLVGYLYRRCVIGARGVELFPHLSFWREFPYLVQVRNVFFLILSCNPLPYTCMIYFTVKSYYSKLFISQTTWGLPKFKLPIFPSYWVYTPKIAETVGRFTSHVLRGRGAFVLYHGFQHMASLAHKF